MPPRSEPGSEPRSEARTPSGHVFIATSLDGFIARADGDLSWLLQRDDPAEDHGFAAFIAGIDALVMGAGTYAAVKDFDPWPYPCPVLVLSQRLTDSDLPDRLRGRLRVSAAPPQAAMAQLADAGARRVYVDGGQVIRSFLRAGLIEDMVISVVPVLLGSGLPLFGPLQADLALAHQGTVAFPSGLVQSRYRVLP